MNDFDDDELYKKMNFTKNTHIVAHCHILKSYDEYKYSIMWSF